MNITLFIPGRVPVSYYGGTQRVMYHLGHELARMGHNISLMADAGSYAPWANVIVRNASRPIDQQIPTNTDILHFQDNPVSDNLPIPYIVTCHGNANYLSDESRRFSVYVSKNHAQRFGCDTWVHNGLDWDEYGSVDLTRNRKGFHFLGKAAWRIKNVKGAIDVALGAAPRQTIEIMGGYRLNFKMGFRMTWNPRAHFLGQVDDITKKYVIERSQGLIFPVKWHEPFGLAVTESLYLGAPVFATPYGSLPELVNEEVGFLTDSKSDMISALHQVHIYSPNKCHEYARDCFNSRLMAERYVSIYERVLNGEVLNKHPRQCDRIQTDKLPWHE